VTALEIFELVVLVAGGFAATNTDNLILLVVLMGANPEARSAHTLGFLCSAFAVLAIATVAALVGAAIDPALLGYMGLFPLLFGIYLLVRARLATASGVADAQIDTVKAASSGWLPTAVLMFSNSADSLAIFVPLFAESSAEAVVWEEAVFIVMALLWAGLAWRIADQPQLARRIEAAGERLVPWIMILAGAYILINTGTDTLAGVWGR
jgi:cadmium resistance protein CadD (predicted permease)